MRTGRGGFCRVAAWSLLCWQVLITIGVAEESALAPAESGALTANWPMEHVTLDDGTHYAGLVESESAEVVEFLSVYRRPGRPMYLIVRPLARATIKDLKRLDPKAQAELRERLELFRRRTLVQGRRIEDLKLTVSRQDGEAVWSHAGEWFTLESTANEQMTRRLGVRLGQIFSAYRQLIPPRGEGSGRVHIRVFGSSDEYQAALKQMGLAIRNPAVYLVDRNVILAGSELDRFDEELARIDHQHQRIRKDLENQIAGVPARVKKLGEELEAAGVPASERLRILLAEQRKWSDQRKSLSAQIAAVDRTNAAKFNELTHRMFTRLAHEAFHAYLETYVYPRKDHDVPRWLNEGLAQVFEAGLLEVDSLRIDAPNLLALEKLQADLQSEKPLALRELLTATGNDFLGPHEPSGRVSRAYYYAWGLAYYLAFERGVFDDPVFEAFLSPAAAGLAPVERFEALVGTPLDAFEQKWRAAMLNLDVAR